jgi:hypothetical protein
VAHEIITLEPKDQSIGVVAVVDTFETTTQGLIGVVQPISLPVQVSGNLTAGLLTLNTDPSTDVCRPVTSVLNTDLNNLIVSFPTTMTLGMSWKDSADMKGCQAGIRTSAHLVRSFKVSGETLYEGQKVATVARADTAYIEGEGGLQQHRLSVKANGTGGATYYLDTTTGHLIYLVVDQLLSFDIATLAQRYRFNENSREEFRIVR